MNQSKVTFPVGVPALPLTVTESWTTDPTGTLVTVACAALWIAVTVEEADLQFVGRDADADGPVDPPAPSPHTPTAFGHNVTDVTEVATV